MCVKAFDIFKGRSEDVVFSHIGEALGSIFSNTLNKSKQQQHQQQQETKNTF